MQLTWHLDINYVLRIVNMNMYASLKWPHYLIDLTRSSHFSWHQLLFILLPYSEIFGKLELLLLKFSFVENSLQILILLHHTTTWWYFIPTVHIFTRERRGCWVTYYVHHHHYYESYMDTIYYILYIYYYYTVVVLYTTIL